MVACAKCVVGGSGGLVVRVLCGQNTSEPGLEPGYPALQADSLPTELLQ